MSMARSCNTTARACTRGILVVSVLLERLSPIVWTMTVDGIVGTLWRTWLIRETMTIRDCISCKRWEEALGVSLSWHGLIVSWRYCHHHICRRSKCNQTCHFGSELYGGWPTNTVAPPALRHGILAYRVAMPEYRALFVFFLWSARCASVSADSCTHVLL